MKIWHFEITIDEFKAIARGGREAFRRLSVPKVKKGTIGIVIALKTEDDQTKKRLENDFISELRHHLEEPTSKVALSILQFPEFISRRIDNIEKAELYLRRARGRLIVHGDLVQRQIEGKTNYVFRVHGLVIHGLVGRAVSDQLAKEFRELLPHRLAFPLSDELLGFEFTQQWIGFVARYIIGIAAIISGVPNVAEHLFLKLERELSEPHLQKNVPVLDVLKERIPLRLVDTYHTVLRRQYLLYTRDLDRKHIIETRKVLEKLSVLAPDEYYGRLMWAILLFFEGRIEDAIKTLINSKEKDVTWRFSLGFLYAYNGEIENALEQYRKASYGEVASNIFNDIEVFISEVLEKEPEKTQLYFFRGLVSYKSKADYRLAKNDFELFLSKHDAQNFPKLVELAQKYLTDSRIHLGI